MPKLTTEQKIISNKNKRLAQKYFENKYEWYKARKPKEYILHHKDITLKFTNIERYIEWNPEDLVVMRYGCHTKLHRNGMKFSNEWKEHISKSRKGYEMPNSHKLAISKANKGKHKSGTASGKTRTGMHWYNNGIIQTYAKQCPVGFQKGMLRRSKNANQNAA